MEASREQIREVLLAADRCFHSRKGTAADVLLILTPYLECTKVTGVSEWASSGAIGLVHALVGDAYRKEKNDSAAALWYKRASERGVAHAEFYARVVCRAHLTEYYSDALATVERQRSQWKAKPFLKRLFLHFAVIDGILDPDWWYHKLHAKSDYEFLKNAVVEKG
jgi:hypothetical protein